jgi:hypothetical protein
MFGSCLSRRSDSTHPLWVFRTGNLYTGTAHNGGGRRTARVCARALLATFECWGTSTTARGRWVAVWIRHRVVRNRIQHGWLIVVVVVVVVVIIALGRTVHGRRRLVESQTEIRRFGLGGTRLQRQQRGPGNPVGPMFALPKVG